MIVSIITALISLLALHITLLIAMSQGKSSKISFFLQEDIDPKHAYILLFVCCLISGLVDSSIYNGILSYLPPPFKGTLAD